MHHQIHDVAAAPVVPDEIDWFLDALQLVFEPVTVCEESRREAVGERRTESWRGQPHHIVAPESFDERAPDRISFRIAVHQNDRHVDILAPRHAPSKGAGVDHSFHFAK
jgi:hypothetical protein